MDMKTSLFASLLFVLSTSLALADKPEWAGSGKPTEEQKEAHKSAMKAKVDEEINTEIIKEKEVRTDKIKGIEKQQKKKLNQEQKELAKGSDKGKEVRTDKIKGIEKQQKKKLNQGQKELGKGSDKGKEARESRKKWWQFWAE